MIWGLLEIRVYFQYELPFALFYAFVITLGRFVTAIFDCNWFTNIYLVYLDKEKKFLTTISHSSIYSGNILHFIFTLSNIMCKHYVCKVFDFEKVFIINYSPSASHSKAPRWILIPFKGFGNARSIITNTQINV